MTCTENTEATVLHLRRCLRVANGYETLDGEIIPGLEGWKYDEQYARWDRTVGPFGSTTYKVHDGSWAVTRDGVAHYPEECDSHYDGILAANRAMEAK
jgi:hypothetical protein